MAVRAAMAGPSGAFAGAAPGWTDWDERLALGWIRLDPGVRARARAGS
jgi:hypothetical protein